MEKVKLFICSFSKRKFFAQCISLLLCTALFVASVIMLGGCDITSKAISNVDMTPRLIVATTGQAVEDVVENVQPAVVGISAHSNYGSSVGSGVAIADGGYILTNHHVVGGAKTIVVHFANQTQSIAQHIWDDPSLDLAIIKSKTNLPYLETGSSKNLKVGQDIIAIGTPLALQFKHTVTKGIVSALNRTLEVGTVSDVTYMQNLIQHDASINPGNSGGPLISLDCKLVGINTLKASEAEGIGFAIPIEIAQAISERVINNSSYVPAYIGLFGLDSQIAAFYNQTKEINGVYIVSIDKNSPAEQGGVKEGDVLVQVGENSVSTVLDLRMSLYKIDKGERVSLKVLRDGKQIVIEVQAQERK
jgi:S1-C subfamily serine protease